MTVNHSLTPICLLTISTECLGTSEKKLKIGDMSVQIAGKWRDLSAEERKLTVGTVPDDLEAERMEKEFSQSNFSSVVVADTMKSFNYIAAEVSANVDMSAQISLSQQAMKLSVRSVSETLIMTVRSSVESLGIPLVHFTDKHVELFFKHAYRITPSQLAAQLEGYLVSGVSGVVRDYGEEVLFLKAETQKMMSEGLSMCHFNLTPYSH